jgi:hypothetical protein
MDGRGSGIVGKFLEFMEGLKGALKPVLQGE